MVCFHMVISCVDLGLAYITAGSGFTWFLPFFCMGTHSALKLLDITGWFQSPLAWYQLISWALLIVSLVPLYFGVRTLIDRGKPIAQRNEEPQLFTFERTSALVTTGIYRTIRHPSYSSLLLLNGEFFSRLLVGLDAYWRWQHLYFCI